MLIETATNMRAFVLTLFPDLSGGYRTCSVCGHVYGVGEY